MSQHRSGNTLYQQTCLNDGLLAPEYFPGTSWGHRKSVSVAGSQGGCGQHVHWTLQPLGGGGGGVPTHARGQAAPPQPILR